MSPARCFCLLFQLFHLCVALHSPSYSSYGGVTSSYSSYGGVTSCSGEGGQCLPSESSDICSPLDAECDDGYICCEVTTAIPSATTVPASTTVPAQTPVVKATCSNGTQGLSGPIGEIAVMSVSNYENNLNCAWQIGVQNDSIIFIVWEAFDLEGPSTQCPNDYVEIIDGLDVGSQGKKFCGDQNPEDFTSSSNNILIRFSTNGNGTRAGFKLIYISGPPPPSRLLGKVQMSPQEPTKVKSSEMKVDDSHRANKEE